MKKTLILFVMVLTCAAAAVRVQGQLSPGFRPPATPLITHDPYFSIWSFNDKLTDGWSRHWTGATQGLCGLVRIDGRPFRILGLSPSRVAPLPQKSLTVWPTRTVYEFEGQGVRLTLTFLSPLLPHDLDVLSRPVTYLTWQARSLDGRNHEIALYFDTSLELVVDRPDQKVVWSRFKVAGLDVLAGGSQEQPVLAKSGDDLRIDWGYVYLAAERSEQPASALRSHGEARAAFAENGILPGSDDLRMPRPAEDDWPVLAMAFALGSVGAQPVERHVLLAYDDRFAIEYLYRALRPYWRRDGTEASDLLAAAAKDYAELVVRCRHFDEELVADLVRAGGESYAALASLAHRQALAAQKLVADIDGTPMLFPKENFSNGCIGTVDVIYPAAPQLLLFNVELMKATLRPVLRYAALPRWKFPFAPHDLGTYPKANGQVYGGGEKTEENQMPVEESGNMLLLLAGVAGIEGRADFAAEYWPSVEKWARYLKDKGLDPENQLCTDDFAGHLAHNVNLSLKAILALGAYARLCEMRGLNKDASEFRRTAEQFVESWLVMADDGDRFRLAFDKPGTWSQKYNLVWDRILGLNLFPGSVAEKEVRYYLKTQNKYGIPLDNRKDYTKTDWVLWSATLAETKADFEALVAPVYAFANETPNRVPFTDWYNTKDAKRAGFQARSVIGGVFIKMLADPATWADWSRRANKTP